MTAPWPVAHYPGGLLGGAHPGRAADCTHPLCVKQGQDSVSAPARQALYAAVMDGGYHTPARSERASALIDAFAAEVLNQAAEADAVYADVPDTTYAATRGEPGDGA